MTHHPMPPLRTTSLSQYLKMCRDAYTPASFNNRAANHMRAFITRRMGWRTEDEARWKYSLARLVSPRKIVPAACTYALRPPFAPGALDMAPAFPSGRPVYWDTILRRSRPRPYISLYKPAQTDIAVSKHGFAAYCGPAILPHLSNHVGLMRALLFGTEREVTPLAPAGSLHARPALLLHDHFGSANYAHFILDYLPRLLLAERLAGVAPGQMQLLLPEEAPFMRPLLAMLGYEQEHITITEPGRTYRVETLFVLSASLEDFFHPLLPADAAGLMLLRKRLGVASCGPGRRLFVSRADVGGRSIINEAEVWALLQQHGFERVDPGALPPHQQIDLFSSAEWVVGGHGAALANLAFAPASGHFIELMGPAYGSAAFQRLAAGLELKASIVLGTPADGSASPTQSAAPRQDANRQDYRIDPNILAEILPSTPAQQSV